MSAGDQQQQIGEVEPVGEPCGERVRFQVVDREKGPAARKRHRLRRGRAHQQAADQAGPGGGGDAVQVGEAEAGLRHRLAHQRVQAVEMGAGRDFGHDAAIGRMLAGLGEQALG